MLLGAEEIQRLILTPEADVKPLLTSITPEQVMDLEGVGLDLRLGKVMRLDPECREVFLGQEVRRLPKYLDVAYIHEAKQLWELDAGQYYLVQTMEEINTPECLCPVITPAPVCFGEPCTCIVRRWRRDTGGF